MQLHTLTQPVIADVDYVTALCSQVVYEGLVDDTFRIKCGKSQQLSSLLSEVSRAHQGCVLCQLS